MSPQDGEVRAQQPEKLVAEKHYCSVCDARKKCHVCANQTLYACSDCRIDFGVTIYVCPTKECREAHELKCPESLREKLAASRRATFDRAIEIVEGMRWEDSHADITDAIQREKGGV